MTKANKAAEFNPLVWGMSQVELDQYTSRGVRPIDALRYWDFKITPAEAEILNRFGIDAATAVNSLVAKTGTRA